MFSCKKKTCVKYDHVASVVVLMCSYGNDGLFAGSSAEPGHRRRMDYRVQREILDEGEVEELGQKFDHHLPFSERVKKSVR